MKMVVTSYAVCFIPRPHLHRADENQGSWILNACSDTEHHLPSPIRVMVSQSAYITMKVQKCTALSTKGKEKGKAVPLQAWSGPEGSSKLRFPDFMTTAQDGGKVVSLTHRPPLPPGNTPGTHFC
jgi:hypothetical protein